MLPIYPEADGGSVLKRTEAQSAVGEEESRIKDTVDRVRSQERKRKKLEEKVLSVLFWFTEL